jgi:NitT/TauT family transport system permease protein
MQVNTLQSTLRPGERRSPLSRLASRRYASLLTIVIVLALWQVVTMLEIYPDFIIPPPRAVVEKFYNVALAEPLSQIAPQWFRFEEGRRVEFWLHVGTTVQEVLAGLVVGVSIGVGLGYAIAKSRFLESLLSPIIVAFQSTPVVAYAPLLVIWFGSQWESKVITATLIVFFPMLVNTIVGIRNVPPPLRDLMRSLLASRWQTFVHLEIPAATLVLMAGLRTSVTLAVIGAVVGEFVSANAGLGYLVTVARNQYDTPLVLVAVLTMTTIARVLYGLVTLVEQRVLVWQLRRGR